MGNDIQSVHACRENIEILVGSIYIGSTVLSRSGSHEITGCQGCPMVLWIHSKGVSDIVGMCRKMADRIYRALLPPVLLLGCET